MILTVVRQCGDPGVHCGDPECDGGHAFLAMLDDDEERRETMLVNAVEHEIVEYPVCAVCGVTATDMSVESQSREVTEEPAELWPGGPEAMVPLLAARHEHVPGSTVCTLRPCGHEVPPETVRIVTRPKEGA